MTSDMTGKISAEAAIQFAQDWIDAWNHHDLEAILSHYTDDMELSSPLIVTVAEEPSGTLRGKQAIREYWAKALRQLPNLQFELRDILVGVGSIALYYQGHRSMVTEVFIFDRSGKVAKSRSCYGIDPAQRSMRPMADQRE